MKPARTLIAMLRISAIGTSDESFAAMDNRLTDEGSASEHSTQCKALMKIIRHEASVSTGHNSQDNTEDDFVWRVERELARLPQEDREILFQCVNGRMSYEEIGLLLSIPAMCVRQRIRHVRETLRTRLYSECRKAGHAKLPPAQNMTDRKR